MLNQSVEKLRALRLTGMARALEAQLTQSDIAQLTFDERLALLIDREDSERHNAALAQSLRLARLRQAACPEDIDYRKPRGLDRALLRSLLSRRWLAEQNNFLVLGPFVLENFHCVENRRWPIANSRVQAAARGNQKRKSAPCVLVVNPHIALLVE